MIDLEEWRGEDLRPFRRRMRGPADGIGVHAPYSCPAGDVSVELSISEFALYPADPVKNALLGVLKMQRHCGTRPFTVLALKSGNDREMFKGTRNKPLRHAPEVEYPRFPTECANEVNEDRVSARHCDHLMQEVVRSAGASPSRTREGR